MDDIDAHYAPTQSFSGSIKCYCTSSSSCGWSSSIPSESTVVDSTGSRCNDDIDNDCDGKCDFDTSGCKTSTREGAGLNECPTCADAGGQACYTSQPSTWGSCGEEKTIGDPYCYAKSGSSYECYGCVSGCTYTRGECCKTFGSSCSTNDVCCGYDGTASGYNCVSGSCQDTSDCTDDGLDACSTSYWSLACLVPSAPATTACCSCTVAGFTAGCLIGITTS